VQPPPRTHRYILSKVAAVAVAVGLVAVGLYNDSFSMLYRDPPSLAVLPLANRSTEPDSDLFVDGLTDEIIQNLAIIEGLDVRSRMSSFAFKDKPRDLREVAQKLDVDYVVEGYVLGSGPKKRINVQLVEVASNTIMWAGPYDREIASSNDVADILDEVARAIVNKLRLTLGRGQRRYDLDLNTYEKYLKGRALLARRGIPSLDAAADLFKHVVARYPTFAPAHAALASTFALIAAPTSSRMPFAEAHVVVRQAAEKALDFDPMLPEAHVAAGWMYTHDHDWGKAEESFRKAIALNPSLTQAYTNYSISTLQPLRRFDEAIASLRTALRNDPLSLEVLREIGTAQLYAGRYREAIETLQRVVAVDHDFPFAELHLGRALTFAGRPAEGLVLLERIDGRHLGRFQAPHTKRSIWLVLPYVMTGRRAEAQAVTAEHHDSAASLAVAYAALGDRDRMIEALERVAVVEPHHLGRILLQPEIAAHLGDARLATLRARFKLIAR
jgi:TolB-like protein/Tfp pilus assembly protein PilF